MDVRVPQLAEAVTEGDISRWLKKDGDRVEKDDALVELETDKATVEIAAEGAGTLEILKPEGETVSVGDLIARIHEGGEKPAAREEQREPPQRKPEEQKPKPPEAQARTETERVVRPEVAAEAEAPEKKEEEDVGPPPREVAPEPAPKEPERGPAQVERAEREPAKPERKPERKPEEAERKPEKAALPVREAEPGTRRVRMTRLRRRIAERLVEAQQTAAILTTFNEIDMSEVMALRKEHQERFEGEHGVRLGFMSFFARASVLALRDIPEINAFIEGEEIVYHDHVHLGIAVGTPKGLVVPVVREADQMSFAEIEREIKRLATKARDGDIAIEDLQGGTFTISNGGIYGSLVSTPILNPPQSGILGMHKIQKRAIVLEDPLTGEERIVSRPMMYVALSYDHRIVDGEQAVTFLIKIKERLEDPARLLLDS